ncbi:MAG: DUF4275 family protein [Planctomycetota bacterium]
MAPGGEALSRQEELKSRGFDCERVVELPQREVWSLQQRWRRHYALHLHRATGKWTHLGFDWHVFSYGYCDHRRGRSAAESLRERLASEVHLFADGGASRTWGVTATLRAYESLEIANDIIVAAPDFSWTFVVSHDGSGGGPFDSDAALRARKVAGVR